MSILWLHTKCKVNCQPCILREKIVSLRNTQHKSRHFIFPCSVLQVPVRTFSKETYCYTVKCDISFHAYSVSVWLSIYLLPFFFDPVEFILIKPIFVKFSTLTINEYVLTNLVNNILTIRSLFCSKHSYKTYFLQFS